MEVVKLKSLKTTVTSNSSTTNSMNSKTVTFDEQSFMRDLVNLKDSQESIQSLSTWIIANRKSCYKMSRCWLKVIRKVRMEQKLTLFYLFNDVAQHSKRKEEYKEVLMKQKSVLKEAMPFLKDDKIVKKVRRVLEIWKERCIFDDKKFVEDLEMCVSDPVGNVAGNVSTNSYDEEVVDNFQPSHLCTQLKIMKALEDDCEYKHKNIQTENAENFDMLDIESMGDRLKDRKAGDTFFEKYEKRRNKHDVFIKSLEKELAKRRTLLDLLSQSDKYYASLLSEAKIVSTAYVNFESRIDDQHTKLEDIMKDLPEVSSPAEILDAPSPSAFDDNELQLNLPDCSSESPIDKFDADFKHSTVSSPPVSRSQTLKLRNKTDCTKSSSNSNSVFETIDSEEEEEEEGEIRARAGVKSKDVDLECFNNHQTTVSSQQQNVIPGLESNSLNNNNNFGSTLEEMNFIHSGLAHFLNNLKSGPSPEFKSTVDDASGNQKVSTLSHTDVQNVCETSIEGDEKWPPSTAYVNKEDEHVDKELYQPNNVAAQDNGQHHGMTDMDLSLPEEDLSLNSKRNGFNSTSLPNSMHQNHEQTMARDNHLINNHTPSNLIHANPHIQNITQQISNNTGNASPFFPSAVFSPATDSSSISPFSLSPSLLINQHQLLPTNVVQHAVLPSPNRVIQGTLPTNMVQQQNISMLIAQSLQSTSFPTTVQDHHQAPPPPPPPMYGENKAGLLGNTGSICGGGGPSIGVHSNAPPPPPQSPMQQRFITPQSPPPPPPIMGLGRFTTKASDSPPPPPPLAVQSTINDRLTSLSYNNSDDVDRHFASHPPANDDRLYSVQQQRKGEDEDSYLGRGHKVTTSDDPNQNGHFSKFQHHAMQTNNSPNRFSSPRNQHELTTRFTRPPLRGSVRGGRTFNPSPRGSHLPRGGGGTTSMMEGGVKPRPPFRMRNPGMVSNQNGSGFRVPNSHQQSHPHWSSPSPSQQQQHHHHHQQQHVRPMNSQRMGFSPRSSRPWRG